MSNQNPRIDLAMQKIEAILKEMDVAGVIVLYAPSLLPNKEDKAAVYAHGHANYSIRLESSFSAIEQQFDGVGMGVVIKGKAEHYGGDKDGRNRKLSDTVNMLSSMSQACLHVTTMVQVLCDRAMKTWDGENTNTRHDPHGPGLN